MSWKDLYSEVKKRKMEALDKKDVVKAVEKHGRVLAVEGKFEKPKKVISHMYASEKMIVKPNDILKYNLNDYDIVFIGCPGNQIPSAAHQKIKEYVANHSGWIFCTDWAIRSIIEYIFPGYIRWNEQRTDDVVVACQIVDPSHPFLDGVVSEISQSKWQKGSSKNAKAEEFRWWLENRSFPIQILNHSAVRVLIASWEIKNKWGEAPVLVEFDYGHTGGKIIHMISHTHLQKGGEKGKFASALILTNILDEKVSRKVGIARGPAPHYVSNWEAPQSNLTQQPLEDQWVTPPQQTNYLTPSTGNSMGLTGTSQIVEINTNDPNFSYASNCEYCGYDFGEYAGKIFKCQECGALYHDNCINMQINEGICKKCNKILLW
ncbi:MAG: hypothetical protein ACTSQJ_06285 [Promethearchaeota archaeon]